MIFTKEILVELELDDVKEQIHKEAIKKGLLTPQEKYEIEEIDIGQYVIKVFNNEVD